MNSVTESKFFVPAVTMIGLSLVLAAFNRVIVDKVADRVVKKLQRDYSPSPFSPGFDPDKIDISSIRK